tara:strand:- start:105 stop:632 length:528 start_codon:yes stop_codon:yes gene_type:complete
MGVEIERRFLVDKMPEINVEEIKDIIQYYLPMQEWLAVWPGDYNEIQSLLIESTTTFRLRSIDNLAYATIKGKSDGATRLEFEMEIEHNELELIVKNMNYPYVKKQRMVFPVKDGLFWEIDNFRGDNLGLIIAEIEIPSENYPIELPNWLGEEITGEDGEWSNHALAINPLKNRA